MKEVRGYTIGVVAKKLGITQQTIRLYEQKGLIEPFRSPGKTRFYTDDDLRTLEFIQHLTQDMGVNLAGVEVVFKLKNKIRQLQSDKEQLLKLLYEAGELVQNLMNDLDTTSLPVKSSLGCLVKYSD